MFVDTHNSESQGQEEAGCMQQTSALFTHMYQHSKLSDTVNKAPWKLSPRFRN